MFGMPTFQSQIHSIRDLDLNFLYLCYDARSYMGMLLASTLVMKLIDACRERIFSRKSNLHFLVANDESYALAA